MAFLCLQSFFLLALSSSSKRVTKAMMVFGLFSNYKCIETTFFFFRDFIYSYVSLNYVAAHAGQHNALCIASAWKILQAVSGIKALSLKLSK